LHETLADVVVMISAGDDDGASGAAEEETKVEDGMMDGSDEEGAAVDDTIELLLMISGVEDVGSDGTTLELASEADVKIRDSDSDMLLGLGLQREAWTSWPAVRRGSARAPRLGIERVNDIMVS